MKNFFDVKSFPYFHVQTSKLNCWNVKKKLLERKKKNYWNVKKKLLERKKKIIGT